MSYVYQFIVTRDTTEANSAVVMWEAARQALVEDRVRAIKASGKENKMGMYYRQVDNELNLVVWALGEELITEIQRELDRVLIFTQKAQKVS
jgi:preprotein translocase subunit SecE